MARISSVSTAYPSGTPSLTWIIMFFLPPGTCSTIPGMELNSIAFRQARCAGKEHADGATETQEHARYSRTGWSQRCSRRKEVGSTHHSSGCRTLPYSVSMLITAKTALHKHQAIQGGSTLLMLQYCAETQSPPLLVPSLAGQPPIWHGPTERCSLHPREPMGHIPEP